MASNSHEMTQYARYEGGSLNTMLNSLHKELRAIVANAPVNHDGNRLLAVEHAEVLVAIIELLDTEFFPLFSSGASPKFVSFGSGDSLASTLAKLQETIGSLEKYKNTEHELESLQNAFVMFRVFRTIQLALMANNDLKVLLDFFNECSLDGRLSPISYCKDSPNPYTFKVFAMKELCLSDVIKMVCDAADTSKSYYIEVACKDGSCDVTTQDDNELEQELKSINDLIIKITSQSWEISNSAVEGEYVDKWGAYCDKKARLAGLSLSLEDAERRFSEAEQKIFSDAGLCFRQFGTFGTFDTVSSIVKVSPINLNRTVLLINERMNELREEIVGGFKQRLSDIKITITDNMSLVDNESLILQLERLKNELTAYPHLFESDEFNNQIIDLISQHTAIVNFQQGAERYNTSVQHLKNMEDALAQGHHGSVVTETETTNESLSSGSNKSLDSLESEVEGGISNGSPNLGDSVSFSGDYSEDKQDAVIPQRRLSMASLVRLISGRTKKISEGVTELQPKKKLFGRLWDMSAPKGTNLNSVRGSSSSQVNSAPLEVDTNTHAECDASQNVDDTMSLARNKVSALQEIITLEVTRFDLTSENMPDRNVLDNLYQQALESRQEHKVSNQVAFLLADEHVKNYLNGKHDVRVSLDALEETVNSHVDSEYKRCVKIESRFEQRVNSVREKISLVAAKYNNARDLNTVINNRFEYANLVSTVEPECADINIEIQLLNQLMQVIGEEVHIYIDGMPDASALNELKFNLSLVELLNNETAKGAEICDFEITSDSDNAKQELHVVAATTRNLFQQSFIHKVNALWLDRDSAIVRKVAEGDVNFQEVVDLFIHNDPTQNAVQHLESMQKHLQEMDTLLGNKYNLEGTLALYLHEFISQPADSKTADNLQKVLLKCKHKLHSYDAEVAKQDKSLWDRKVTVVINLIPIIGQIVMAACYFYNKSNYGIGFFPWETTKKQDAQKKVEKAFAELEHSSSLLSASVAG